MRESERELTSQKHRGGPEPELCRYIRENENDRERPSTVQRTEQTQRQKRATVKTCDETTTSFPTDPFGLYTSHSKLLPASSPPILQRPLQPPMRSDLLNPRPTFRIRIQTTHHNVHWPIAQPSRAILSHHYSSLDSVPLRRER